MSQNQPKVSVIRGIVKQVQSADVIIIRGVPKGGPPPEKTLVLSNIVVPKLARRPTNAESFGENKDEPWAWDAREFIRKKVVGKEVFFLAESKGPNAPAGREYGVCYLGKDNTGENLTEALLAEGLAEVKTTGPKSGEDYQRYEEIQASAKSAKKGKWGTDSPQAHVRDIKWICENSRSLVESFKHKPIKAVIEHVRDGSTVRAFLLPDFHYITLMISGVRSPMMSKQGDDKGQPEPFAEEAKFFTESRLLQRDVEIILESVNNNNFVGSIKHPNGNIAELLLKEGLSRCVDWSMAFAMSADKLRAAERMAKSKRLRLWKDYESNAQNISSKDKEFTGTVIEIVSADCLMVKVKENNHRKIFLSSIRPPPRPEGDKPDKKIRPLYDVPYMYEAREFLRKKLIGKNVQVSIDYIQPATPQFPEKTCCTVMFGGVNLGEALVSNGLATVVRYKQNDDQRSFHYDELLAAENKAIKAGLGLHSKGPAPVQRVVDITQEHSRAKQFQPFLTRAGRTEAVVEFVASGSRFRVFVPKETCIITFLLAGINSPRPKRPGPSGSTGTLDAEPWGEEALAFVKERCMQREVEIEVESMDRGGNFIGWMWVDNKNLSLTLVENGFASVHFSAAKSPYNSALVSAENVSKANKDKIWANYVEPKPEDEIAKAEQKERIVNHKKVIVTEVTPEMQFYAQNVEEGTKLVQLMDNLRQEFKNNPPLEGAYRPQRGDLCAAKFNDNQWYRAKVEKIVGSIIHILYIDYGNREATNTLKLGTLPPAFASLPAFAHLYALACVKVPEDTDYSEQAIKCFYQDTQDATLLLNEEIRMGGLSYVTLLTEGKDDMAKGLIEEGLLLVDERKEKHLRPLVEEYVKAQDTAKKSRNNIWEYGDFVQDADLEYNR